MVDHRARSRANVPADTAPGLARTLGRERHTLSLEHITACTTWASLVHFAFTGGQSPLRRFTRGFGGGSVLHPAITRAISRAFAPSVMPGNNRRSSMPADNSPSCSKAVRIMAASASVTLNILHPCAEIHLLVSAHVA